MEVFLIVGIKYIKGMDFLVYGEAYNLVYLGHSLQTHWE